MAVVTLDLTPASRWTLPARFWGCYFSPEYDTERSLAVNAQMIASLGMEVWPYRHGNQPITSTSTGAPRSHWDEMRLLAKTWAPASTGIETFWQFPAGPASRPSAASPMTVADVPADGSGRSPNDIAAAYEAIINDGVIVGGFEFTNEPSLQAQVTSAGTSQSFSGDGNAWYIEASAQQAVNETIDWDTTHYRAYRAALRAKADAVYLAQAATKPWLTQLLIGGPGMAGIQPDSYQYLDAFVNGRPLSGRGAWPFTDTNAPYLQFLSAHPYGDGFFGGVQAGLQGALNGLFYVGADPFSGSLNEDGRTPTWAFQRYRNLRSTLDALASGSTVKLAVTEYSIADNHTPNDWRAALGDFAMMIAAAEMAQRGLYQLHYTSVIPAHGLTDARAIFSTPIGPTTWQPNFRFYGLRSLVAAFLNVYKQQIPVTVASVGNTPGTPTVADANPVPRIRARAGISADGTKLCIAVANIDLYSTEQVSINLGTAAAGSVTYRYLDSTRTIGDYPEQTATGTTGLTSLTTGVHLPALRPGEALLIFVPLSTGGGVTPPVNVTPPSFTGSAVVGQTLSGDPGSWQGGPTFAYQWQSSPPDASAWTNISAATGRNYAVVAADQGKILRLTVVGTNAGGSSAAAVSSPSGVVFASAAGQVVRERVLTSPPANAASGSVAGVQVDAQNNRYLEFVWQGQNDGNQLTTVAYVDEAGGSTPMVVDARWTAGGIRQERWALVAPNVGVGRVDWTKTGAVDHLAQATVYHGVDPTTPRAGLVTSNATADASVAEKTATVLAASNAAGDLVEAAFASSNPDAGSSTSTMGHTAAGASSSSTPPNLLRLNKYTAPASGTITAMKVRLSNPGGSGQAFRAAVYADDGTGKPGALLVLSNEVTVAAGAAAADVDFPLPSSPAVTSGQSYFIGVYTGGPTNNGRYFFDNAAMWSRDNVTYPTAPNPYGAATDLTLGQQLTAYATITTTTTASPDATVHAGTVQLWSRHQGTRRGAAAESPGTGANVVMGFTPGGGAPVDWVIAAWAVKAFLAPVAPANLTPPTIAGTPVSGQTLTADPGVWSGSTPIAFTYQWQRGNLDGTGMVNIGGAAAQTYVQTSADVGSAVRVVVTATNAAGAVSKASLQQVATQAVPPANTALPVISGLVQAQQPLARTLGTWTGDLPISYATRWEASGDQGASWVPIANAVEATFTPTSAQVGQRIRVVVTATNAAGSVPATSDSTLPIAPAPAQTVSVSASNRVALARYKVEVGWDLTPGGLFRLGTSLLGSSLDRLAASKFSEAFNGTEDDITADVSDDGFEIERGRSDDLGPMQSGTCTIHLTDATGKYNRKNPLSPLAGALEPLRPVRVSATLTVSQTTGLSPLGKTVVGGDYADAGLDFRFGNRYLAATDLLCTRAWARLGGGGPDGPGTTRQFRVVVYEVVAGVPGNLVALSNERAVAYADAPAWVEFTFPDQVTLHAGSTYLIGYHTGGQQAARLYMDVVAGQESYHADTYADGTDLTFGAAGTAGNVYSLYLDTSVLVTEDVDYPLFYGFTRRITFEPQGRSGFATIECNDLFVRMRDRFKPTIATVSTTTGGALGLILDAFGWTEPEGRELAVGDPVTFGADGTVDGLDLVDDLLTAEQGSAFVAADGSFRYLSRYQKALLPALSSITNVMSAIAPSVDLDRVVNVQKVQRLDTDGNAVGDPVEARDDASVRLYDEREGALISTRYIATNDRAADLGAWVVSMRKDPQSDLWSLDLENRDHAVLVAMLARDLSDRVQLAEAQTGTVGDWHVEQITHRVSRGGLTHQTSWRLSERSAIQPFILGVSALGGADALAF